MLHTAHTLSFSLLLTGRNQSREDSLITHHIGDEQRGSNLLPWSLLTLPPLFSHTACSLSEARWSSKVWAWLVHAVLFPTMFAKCAVPALATKRNCLQSTKLSSSIMVSSNERSTQRSTPTHSSRLAPWNQRRLEQQMQQRFQTGQVSDQLSHQK